MHTWTRTKRRNGNERSKHWKKRTVCECFFNSFFSRVREKKNFFSFLKSFFFPRWILFSVNVWNQSGWNKIDLKIGFEPKRSHLLHQLSNIIHFSRHSKQKPTNQYKNISLLCQAEIVIAINICGHFTLLLPLLLLLLCIFVIRCNCMLKKDYFKWYIQYEWKFFFFRRNSVWLTVTTVHKWPTIDTHRRIKYVINKFESI